MTTTRTASLVAAVCAVLYLLVLPSLPDGTGTADDFQWLLGVVVAATGVTALLVAVRGKRRSSGR